MQRLPQDIIFYDFTQFWDPIWRPVLGHFGYHFFVFFYDFSYTVFSQNNGNICKKGTKNVFEIYLKSDLGSIFYDFLYTVFLNDPIMFLLYFTGLSCSKQQEKHTFGNISRCFLRTLFWDGFGMTFSCFLLFFGSLLATFFVAFWTPFWHRFSEGLRDSAKVKAGREVTAIEGYLGS